MTDSSSTSEPRDPVVAWLSLGQGRPVGILLLVVCLAIQTWWLPSPLQALRTLGFDSYQQVQPRVPKSRPVIIVAIDEKSLAARGQWPWPRSLLADLVNRIAAAKPAVLGLDLLWPEPDRLSPENWQESNPSLPPDLRRALQSAQSNDELFGAAIRRTRTVVATFGVEDASQGVSGPNTLVRVVGDDPASALDKHPAIGRSVPPIDQAATGRGIVSAHTDADGITRQLPLAVTVGGRITPAFTTEILRLAANANWVDVGGDAAGLVGVQMGDLFVPTASDGTVRPYFSLHDKSRFISASDVLDGKGDDDIEGRIILLGVTGLGLVDQPTTPLGQKIPGVEVHAQFLENVFEGDLLSRPRWAPYAEAALLAVLGIAFVVAVPLLNPIWSGMLLIGGIVLSLGVGGVAFGTKLWLIDALNPMAGGGVVFVAMLGITLGETQREKRAIAQALEDEKLAVARMTGELEAARRIQMGILPTPAALPEDTRLDLHALIEPAKEIGGDLYDFFYVDADHFYFAVGDVTGKGVPASLFMALSKALTKSAVLRSPDDIATIALEANAEINRDNAEMLFVTLYAGILDLRTGALAWCNAGHDRPWLVTAEGDVSIIDDVGGPPLCVVDDFRYEAENKQLTPGDLLIVTSDGVNEAMNANRDLYGHEKLEAALTALANNCAAETALDGLRADVARHVDGADPSDDLTIIALRWLGPAA